MKEAVPILVAIATAIGAVASCTEKTKPSSGSVPPPKGGDVVVVVPPPPVSPPPASSGLAEVSPAAPPDGSPNRRPDASGDPNMAVTSPTLIEKIREAALRNKAIKETLSQGNSGEALINRTIDFRNLVMNASFIAQNRNLINQLTGPDSEITSALDEAALLGQYKSELAKLEALQR